MLYLVRHGRTAANASGLLQGRLDPPLDEIGCIQADAAAALIGPVDAVISSSLERARQTAERFSRSVTIDDRWMEVAYGRYEGVHVDHVPSDVWEAWRVDDAFAPDGGESFGDVNRRVRAACDELVDRIATQDIVVVSHVAPIKAAVAWALNTTIGIMFHCHLAQGSVTRIGTGKFGPLLVSFNELPEPSPR